MSDVGREESNVDHLGPIVPEGRILSFNSVADLENEKGWFQFIVALARRKIFVGHAHFGSCEDTYLSHDSASKLPLTLSAQDAYIYMHKSPLPFPAGCTYICTPNLLYFRVSSYLLCILPRVLLLSSASTTFALHALQH